MMPAQHGTRNFLQIKFLPSRLDTLIRRRVRIERANFRNCPSSIATGPACRFSKSIYTCRQSVISIYAWENKYYLVEKIHNVNRPVIYNFTHRNVIVSYFSNFLGSACVCLFFARGACIVAKWYVVRGRWIKRRRFPISC